MAEKGKLESSKGRDNGELFNNRLIVRMRTLTPIWTGDIDQKSEYIQTLGIMGSLRWWTEAILRGIGKYACDPTDDRRCPKDENNKSFYCYACLIFGATGIRRMFRLNVNMKDGYPFFDRLLNIRPLGRSRGWYLGSGILGEINLEIIPLKRDFDGSLVLLPIAIASRWGGIGARTQHGYGVVEVEDYPRINFDRFKEEIEKVADQERLSEMGIGLRHESSDELPNIKEMFFAKIQLEAEDYWWEEVDGISPLVTTSVNSEIKNWLKFAVPVAPAIKNWLRYHKDGVSLWKTSNINIGIENWLFGATKRICSYCYKEVKRNKYDPQRFWCQNCHKSLEEKETFEKIASKINISSAYPVDGNYWEFRIWGWIPRNNLPTGFNREKFLDNLKQALTGNYPTSIRWVNLLGTRTKNHKLKVWREFASLRDTAKQNEREIENYLQSLLNGEGGKNDL
jgi:CRISPR-associated protein Cmr1